MANANISSVVLTNTFNEWRVATNDLITDRNTLRNSNYVKDGGDFTFANSSVTVQKDGGGTVFTVANDAAVSGTLTTSNLTVVSNVTAGNANITGDLIASGNITFDSNTFYVNSVSNRVIVGAARTLDGTFEAEITDNSSPAIIATRYSAANQIGGGLLIGRQARGTTSSPIPLIQGDSLTFWGGRGYSNNFPSANGFTPTSPTGIGMYMAQNLTNTTYGSFMTLETTANNTTARTERVRITESGNVGISNTNPQSKLTVAGIIESTTGGIKFPDGTIQLTSSGGGNTAFENVTITGDLVASGNITFDSNTFYVNSVSNRVIVGAARTLDGTFEAEITENSAPAIIATRYSTTGQVGGGLLIGRQARGTTSVPTPLLEGDSLTFWGGRGYSNNFPSANGFTPTSPVGIGMYLSQNLTNTSYGSFMTLETTANNTTARTERVRITESGNVGISNTNPQSKLTVAGVIESTTGGIKFPDGTTQTTAGGAGGGYGNANVALFLANYGSNTITTNGNITAGNVNITSDLIASGNITFDSNTFYVNSVSNRVIVGAARTLDGTFEAEITENSAPAIIATRYASVGTAGGGLLVGRQARGSSSSPEPLRQNDTLTFWGGRGYSNNFPSANGFTPISTIGIGMYASQNVTNTTYGSYMTFETTANNTTTRSERIRITESGNVGIGTTAPSTRLDVRQDNSSTSQLAGLSLYNTNTTANSQVGIGLYNYDNFSAKIYSPRTGTSIGNLLFATNDGGGIGESNLYERVRIGTSGLQVSNGAIIPTTGNSNTVGIQFPSNPGGGVGDSAYIRYFARSGEATTLLLGNENDSNDHIAVIPSGNFGVGTISPTSKLQVVGNVAAAGVIESTTGGFKFPDGTTQTTTGVSAANTLTYQGILLASSYSDANTAYQNAIANGWYQVSNPGVDTRSTLVFNGFGSTGAVQLEFGYTGTLRWRNQTDETTWTPFKDIYHSGNPPGGNSWRHVTSTYDSARVFVSATAPTSGNSKGDIWIQF